MREERARQQSGFTSLEERLVRDEYEARSEKVKQAIEKGWFPGPTVVNSGKIIGPFGGQSHGYAPEQGPFWRFEYLEADTPDEVRKAVRQAIYYGATCIKLVADNESFHMDGVVTYPPDFAAGRNPLLVESVEDFDRFLSLTFVKPRLRE